MPNDRVSETKVGRTDWARLRAMPEDEIERTAAADQDNPATVSDDEWAQATIGPPPTKISVHAQFDSDVVAFLKRGGRSYRSRMNSVLRRYMDVQRMKTNES